MRKTFFVGLVLALFIGILAGENTDINNTHAFGLDIPNLLSHPFRLPRTTLSEE